MPISSLGVKCEISLAVIKIKHVGSCQSSDITYTLLHGMMQLRYLIRSICNALHIKFKREQHYKEASLP